MIVHANTGGLGDELMTTAWVREYHRAFPDEMIRLGKHRRDLWRHNPRVNVGNQDNGLTVNPLVEGWKVSGWHFPHGHAKDHGFELLDPTPEVFLADHERDVAYWPVNGRPTVAIDCGAGWESRRWPADRWAEVALALLADGWTVLEVGARLDGQRSPHLPHTWSFYGRHSIRQTAVVLSQCDVFLGHDSGLMHLAAAVGTPQVALFASTKSKWRATPTTEVIEVVEPCPTGCVIKCALTDDGQGACLRGFTAADVLAAIPRAIARRKAVAS